MRLDYEPCAVVGLVVDLAAADAERLPEKHSTTVEGVEIRRLAVAMGLPALPAVLALVGRIWWPSRGLLCEEARTP